jgi:hypothetical protein
MAGVTNDLLAICHLYKCALTFTGRWRIISTFLALVAELVYAVG